jgi:hypothetical protein
MKLLRWFWPLKKKEPPEVILPKVVSLQGLFLGEDELLVYIDELDNQHLITSAPYDKERKYQILILRHDEL